MELRGEGLRYSRAISRHLGSSLFSHPLPFPPASSRPQGALELDERAKGSQARRDVRLSDLVSGSLDGCVHLVVAISWLRSSRLSFYSRAKSWSEELVLYCTYFFAPKKRAQPYLCTRGSCTTPAYAQACFPHCPGAHSSIFFGCLLHTSLQHQGFSLYWCSTRLTGPRRRALSTNVMHHRPGQPILGQV